jgi:hypothetical protein
MTKPGNAAERRITLRLLAYWEKLRGERAMPHEDDIDPDDLKDLWDRCFLIHVQDLDKPDYNYTYLGKAIDEAYHHGLSQGDPNGMLSPNANDLAHGYAKVIETGKPLLEEGEFTNLHQEVVKYRQCLLPLGQNGKIEAIFGGMHFKIFV